MSITLQVVDCVLPIGCEDVFILAREALMDICPRSCVKVGWGKAFGCKCRTSAIVAALTGVIDRLLATVLGMGRPLCMLRVHHVWLLVALYKVLVE